MKSNSKMKFKIALLLLYICYSNCIVKALNIQNSSNELTEERLLPNLTVFEPSSDDNKTTFSFLGNLPKEDSSADNTTTFSFLGNLPEEGSSDNELGEDESDESKGDVLEDFVEPQNPKEFMDYFEDLMQRTRVRLEELFEQYMPQLIQMSSTVTLSPSCTFDAIRILFGLRTLKPWAIKSECETI